MPAGYAATTGLESVFEDMYAAELYDLRVFEANAALGVFEPLGIQEPSNVVREDEEFRLAVRIRFTGPLHYAIIPNRIIARFFLEGIGFTANEVDIGKAPRNTLVEGELAYTSRLPEAMLQKPGMYRLQVVTELAEDLASPGYFEVPLLKVV